MRDTCVRGERTTIYGSSVDDDFLARALELAMQARERGDHPFGALLVVDGEIVAEPRYRVVSNHDITAHAELMLVRELDDGDRQSANAHIGIWQ